MADLLRQNLRRENNLWVKQRCFSTRLQKEDSGHALLALRAIACMSNLVTPRTTRNALLVDFQPRWTGTVQEKIGSA